MMQTGHCVLALLSCSHTTRHIGGTVLVAATIWICSGMHDPDKGMCRMETSDILDLCK